MATEDEAAVAGIATPSKPDKEEEKATEQTVADAVADVDAPAPQEPREEQIENAIAFLAHPKVARPLTQLLTQMAPVHGWAGEKQFEC